MKMPPGTCDVHAHVFVIDATHSSGTFEEYDAMHRQLGIERGVLIQSSSYGTDNSVLVETLRRGAPHLRGIVAIMPEDLTDAEIARLDEAGVRGIRINRYAKAGPQFEHMEAVAERIADAGWHVEIAAHDIETYVALRPVVERLPCPVVFDMFAQAKIGLGIEHPMFREILSMLRAGVMWQKLSHGDRVSKQGPPFADLVPFGRAFVEANPSRCLWGTDWPHRGAPWTISDNAVFADLLEAFAPDEATRHRILVDNPAELHRFPAPRQ